MSSSIPSALLTELEGQARVHYVFELTLAGTTYKFATQNGVNSLSEGMYLPYVSSFGSISRGVGFPALGLETPRTSVSVFDETRELQKAIGGPANGEVFGAAAKIVMRSNHVTAANHSTRVDGTVKDYGMSSARVYDFIIGPDDSPLRSKLKIPKLTTEDWPNIPSKNRNRAGRMLFGAHSSSAIPDQTGGLTAHLVDATAGEWYLSFGHILELTNVWSGDTNVTTDFTLSHVNVNGRPYTIMTDVSAGAPTYTIDDTITFDARGVDTQGDAQASLLEEPPDTLEIILDNLVWGDYPEGATLGNNVSAVSYRWLASEAPIDNTRFTNAQAFLDYYGHRFAKELTSDMTGRDVIQGFVDSFQIPVFWNDSMQIALGAFDNTVRTPYVDNPIRQDQGHVQSISAETLLDDRITQQLVSWAYSASAGAKRTFRMANLDLPDPQVIGTLDMAWGPHSVL